MNIPLEHPDKASDLTDDSSSSFQKGTFHVQATKLRAGHLFSLYPDFNQTSLHQALNGAANARYLTPSISFRI